MPGREPAQPPLHGAGHSLGSELWCLKGPACSVGASRESRLVWAFAWSESAQLGWESHSFTLLTHLVQVWDLGLLCCSESILHLSEQVYSEDWLQKRVF